MIFDLTAREKQNIVREEKLVFTDKSFSPEKIAVTSRLFYDKNVVVILRADNELDQRLIQDVDYRLVFKLPGYRAGGQHSVFAGIILLKPLEIGAQYLISYRALGESAKLDSLGIRRFFEENTEFVRITFFGLQTTAGEELTPSLLQNANVRIGATSIHYHSPLGSKEVVAAVGEMDELEFGAADAITTAGIEFVDARDFNIRPGSDNAVTSSLAAALNAVAAENKVLDLQPGKYIYDNIIDVTGGGGMVCSTGRATLQAASSNYSLNSFSFTGASAANPYIGFQLQGIDFDNITMPNSGLSNGAGEYAGFIRLTNIRDVYVARNRVMKNYGGFLLMRNVRDALVEKNICYNLFKDVFHTTDASFNITRKDNRVFNCGDDAFATVAYVYKGTIPQYIYDYDNYVYGCRRGRAFAYVGAIHVRGRNFVDGRVVNPYQALTPNGHYYRGSCALYIASEYLGSGSTFNTYGCEDVDVRIDAQNMGPTVITPGGGSVSNAIELTNSLSAIRIAENTTAGAGTEVKNIRVQGTVKDSPRICAFITGAEDLDMKLTVINNTDTEGWIGTPGTYTAQATEFQYLRGDCKVDLDVRNCNHIAAVFGGNCKGNLDLTLKINEVVKTFKHDGVFLASGSYFDKLKIHMRLDWDIPGGRLDRFIDIQAAFGSLEVTCTGKGVASNIESLITGGSSTSAPVLGSPQIVANVSDDDYSVQLRGGNVTLVEQARIFVHHARPVTSVNANTITIAGDVTSQYTTNRHCVFMGRAGSPSEFGGAIAISAASFSGGLTTITLASAPPIASSYDRVAPLHTEGFASVQAPFNRFLQLPRHRALRVTYTTAPLINLIAQRQ